MEGNFRHYVPKLLLRNFVGPDGKVGVFDIGSGSVGRKPVKDIAGEFEYYDFPLPEAGGMIAEDALQVVESDAARVIKKIIKSKNVKVLTDNHRQKFARFIAIQSFRTKAFFHGLRTPFTNDSREKIFARLWESLPLYESEILNRSWLLMETTSEREFYLGDHPIALQHTEDPGGARQLGFDVPGVEAYLPIAPTFAVYLPCRSVSDEIVSGYRHAVELHRQARVATLSGRDHPFANPIGLQTLQRVIHSAKSFYDADVTGKSLKSLPENVINFNALQINFSVNEVYSHESDFSFAKEVIEKRPDYSRAISTSLHLFGSTYGEQ